ncbi:MAG: hypothetical protein HQM15_01610 [Deltaproteobacteria bacterium]|nr:hypothetical protein [Deltaproteobacteria bacterium]
MIKKIILILLLICSSHILFAKELSYEKALKKYHRVGEQYSPENFHALYRWEVLWMSPELREAQDKYLAQHYKDSAADLKARETKSEKIEHQYTEFLVFFYTYNKKWNDLDAPESLWQLRLEAAESHLKPSEIIKVKPTPLEESLYPYLAPWVKMYRVRFPVSDSSSELKLSLYGIKGEKELVWKN